ncbi:protein tantalus [Nasonia vitripennis]|uniref:Tantalus-like domain-containing protein n=1 Tax=Nasonia vitripennis TaxID=7425 RepID=A0A7M7LL62_NASVI|nr:protein tantalus [Nasonia vitripennis]
MDKDCKSTSISNETNENQTEEVNLPEVVASLKMLAVDIPEEDEVSPTNPRRSLRKRVPRNLDFSTLNRRCSLKPKKRSFSEMENEEQIKEYYLDKTVKKHTNSLETIFEEKEDSSQSTNCMSVKRFKRMIQFTPEPTDSKIKKRREKIRKVFGSKINYRKRRNVSMQALLDKLNGLQNDLSINNDTK